MATQLPSRLPQAACHLPWAVRTGSLKTLKAFETGAPGRSLPRLGVEYSPAVIARTITAP